MLDDISCLGCDAKFCANRSFELVSTRGVSR